MSHIFPLVSGIHTSTLTAGLPWTGIRDVVFPGFRICCCYARVQVCRETKKSSDCWRSRRCKMPLSYLLSQQQLVNAHASPAFYKANNQQKMVFAHCSADSFCPILQMPEHLLSFFVPSLLPALR